MISAMTRILALGALLFGLLLGGITPAAAQSCGLTNPNCIVPTAPPGTNNNQAASTAFVQAAVSGGSLPLASGKIYIGSVAGAAAAQTMSGDCTLAVNGTITCPTLNGVSPGALYSLGVGTGLGSSGGNLNLQPAAASIIGGTESITCGSNTWLSTISTAGVPSCTQPASTNLSDSSNLARLNTAQSYTGSQRGTPVNIAISTATFTPNFNTGQNFEVDLVHASCPCTLANPSTTLVAGQSGVIEVHQSATGSDTIGTWGSDYQYVGGTSTITLSTTASAVDYMSYYVNNAATGIVLGALLKAPAH